MSEIRFEPEHPSPERALELLRVLAQPVRTKILREMLDGEPMRVSDVAAAIDEAPNSVSYHLRQLEKAGIARRADPAPDRDGRETWWVVPDWRGISVDIADIRGLPGASEVLRSIDEAEANEILSLFSLVRSEAAERTGLPAFRGDGPFRLTREEADALVNQLVEALEHARAVARAHRGDPAPTVHRYDYRLAILPAPDPEGPPAPSTD